MCDPDLSPSSSRKRKFNQWSDIPIVYSPEEVVYETFNATTQHYIKIPMDHRLDPQQHFANRFKATMFQLTQ